MSWKMEPLATLDEALILASVRNECRLHMTNDQQEISPSGQTNWFNQIYMQQNPQNYWIWLLKEASGNIIGYFAAKETDDGFYITEGLLEKKRGVGAGTFMLQTMLTNEYLKKKPLFADIYNHNRPSIQLHKKFDFQEHSLVHPQITRYILRASPC